MVHHRHRLEGASGEVAVAHPSVVAEVVVARQYPWVAWAVEAGAVAVRRILRVEVVALGVHRYPRAA